MDDALRPCRALFREIDGAGGVFGRALDRFFDGRPDPRALQPLAGAR
jgi:hypothetical protein